MFTGLVDGTAELVGAEPVAEGRRLCFRYERPFAAEVGASVALSGVCQTIAACERRPDGALRFEVIAIAETLRRTTLGTLAAGERVHLEPPLRMGDPLGGHWVQGHIDGLGRVVERRESGAELSLRIGVPGALALYVAEKGSVAVDGVSLTVGVVDDRSEGTSFWVHLIPETLRRTLMGGYQVQRSVNLEVDILAKYLERLSRARRNEVGP